MIRTTRAIVQALCSIRFRAAFAVLLMSGMLFAAVDSKACATPGKSPTAVKMPFQEPSNDTYEPTIVGLWHAVYTITGAPPDQSLFAETLKTWHRDGTEFENAVLPPIGGNVCVGVWKEVGPRTVKLHHTGLMFTPSADPTKNVLAATFTIDEMDVVAFDGKTYKGSFVFKQYDLDGNLVVTISGTVAATRISVD
jgi:hypothetical protein